MTFFKKSFVKPFARPSETYTVEDSYWKKLTVRIDLIFYFMKFNQYFLESCISERIWTNRLC